MLTFLMEALQETRTYWFNPSSLEDEDEFMLVGLVLGLAIYNAVLLDFPLPLALYRKLIGQSCTLRDLQDMEPTLGKSLTALLQYEGECVCSEVKPVVHGKMSGWVICKQPKISLLVGSLCSCSHVTGQYSHVA